MNSRHRLLFHGHCQLRFFVGMIVGIIACGAPLLVQAYTEETHRRIVMDALEFVIASRDKTAAYVDGSTGESDYKLLRSAFPKANDDGLRFHGAEMGQAAADTDQRTDVYLRIPFLYFFSFSQHGAGNVSFTTFSHFINVRTPGYAWPVSGYYYGWVEANQKCSDADAEDVIANFFVGNSRARVDTGKSEAFKIYREPLKNVPPTDYEKHMDQRIQHMRFWPLTNLATYWFEQFLRDRRDANGGPYNLPWIGPVLHAAADSTVPYHAAGLSGCGHGVYEAGVKSIYDSKPLYDGDAVEKLLETEKHLDRRLTVSDILTGNARSAAAPPFCQCGLNSCDCPVAKDEAAYHKLVNLAIASTVVVLRKTFSEWQADGGVRQATGLVRPAIPIDAGSRTVSSTADIPISEIFVQPVNTDDTRSMVESLRIEVGELKGIVSDLEMGRSTDGIREKLEKKVDAITNIVSKYPKLEWNPLFTPPRQLEYSSSLVVGSRPIHFRFPTPEELRGDGWNNYIQQRRRYFAARGLYITALTRAAIMGRLSTISSEAKPEAEAYINDLREAEKRYIALLPP